MKIGVPVVLLIERRRRLQDAPQRQGVEGHRPGLRAGQGDRAEAIPDFVKWAHAEGMSVTPYTFRASRHRQRIPDVSAEMAHYLYTLGVDALFTDNPDKFPRR